MMSDLTDQELMEELKKRFDQNKESLAEVQKLNEELKEVNKKLEESESLKSHFISNITNEIINPFSSIQGLAESIMAMKEPDWEKVQSLVSMIYYEAFHLDYQLRNIFVAARLEAGEIYPETVHVDVKKLLQSVVDNFHYEKKKKHLQVIYRFDIDSTEQEPFYFKTDPEKLKLIISNLMSNAIKFSYDGGSILLRCWMEKKQLHIMVKDYGTGISKENQEVIFDRFRKLDSGINSIYRGHGLGLSVNKALIDVLNGDIDFKTREGAGSSFTVRVSEVDSESDDVAYDDNEMFFGDQDPSETGEEETF